MSFLSTLLKLLFGSKPSAPPADPASLNITITGVQNPSTISVSLISDNFPPVAGLPVSPGRFQIKIPAGYSGGADIEVAATGYITTRRRLTDTNGAAIALPQSGPHEIQGITLTTAWPAPPTREEACSIKMHFQGLTIHSPTFGDLPWFSAALPSMDAAGELDNTIDQLLAAGDTHIPVDIVWDYGEAGQPYGTGQKVPPRDLRDDLDTYKRIIDRVVERGARPIIVLSGEGRDGYDWLMANFQRVISSLREGYDRTAYGPVAIWYDGVWPAGWTVDMMSTFLPFARSILGDAAYLAMMFAGGPAENQYLVVKGIEDYAPGGLIYEYLDIMMCTGGASETRGEALGEIASRMLGPAFINDVDGYSGENADGHIFYPSQGCKRGQFFWGWIEWREYEWVRLLVTADDIEADRVRMRRAGVKLLG